MKIKGTQGVLFAMLVLAALLLAACGGAEPTAEAELDTEAELDAGAEAEAEAPAEAEASGPCANPYYPVQEGLSHSYLGISTDSEFTFTTTITAVRADSFTLISEFDGVTVTQEWACTEDGLMALTYGGGAAAAASAD